MFSYTFINKLVYSLLRTLQNPFQTDHNLFVQGTNDEVQTDRNQFSNMHQTQPLKQQQRQQTTTARLSESFYQKTRKKSYSRMRSAVRYPSNN